MKDKKRWTMSLLTLLLLAGCAEQEASGPPTGKVSSGETSSEQSYAGLEERSIRALPAEKVDDLLAGRGAGYALAAELNHYPGPRHVLDLAGELDLTAEQERTVRDVYSTMEEEAKPLGRELVDLEEGLDRSFRNEEIDEEDLVQVTDQIANTEGRLRAAHLSAHLDLKKILSPDQIATYDSLRGYAGSETPESGGAHSPEGHDHRAAE